MKSCEGAKVEKMLGTGGGKLGNLDWENQMAVLIALVWATLSKVPT